MKVIAMFLVALFCGVMLIALATPDNRTPAQFRSETTYTPHTNGDILDRYHREGRFLGYDDPDELARDMKSLDAMGSEQAGNVARELGY